MLFEKCENSGAVGCVALIFSIQKWRHCLVFFEGFDEVAGVVIAQFIADCGDAEVGFFKELFAPGELELRAEIRIIHADFLGKQAAKVAGADVAESGGFF